MIKTDLIKIYNSMCIGVCVCVCELLYDHDDNMNNSFLIPEGSYRQ
jgi:hypothetical protein